MDYEEYEDGELEQIIADVIAIVEKAIEGSGLLVTGYDKENRAFSFAIDGYDDYSAMQNTKDSSKLVIDVLDKNDEVITTFISHCCAHCVAVDVVNFVKAYDEAIHAAPRINTKSKWYSQ